MPNLKVSQHNKYTIIIWHSKPKHYSPEKKPNLRGQEKGQKISLKLNYLSIHDTRLYCLQWGGKNKYANH